MFVIPSSIGQLPRQRRQNIIIAEKCIALVKSREIMRMRKYLYATFISWYPFSAIFHIMMMHIINKRTNLQERDREKESFV